MDALVMNQPRLTIILVTWNGWDDTRRCLDSIFASPTADYEVLVFDNASADGTPDKIERLFPSVRLVRSGENIGHTRGVNRAVAMARADVVLLLDSDTQLEPDAITLLLAFLDRRPDVGLVAPRTYNSDGSVQECARRFPRAINGLFGRQSVLTRLFPGNPLSRRYLISEALSTSDPYEVEQVSGACMLFRKSLFQTVGPWDEGYFGYWVDSDWCFRLRERRGKVFCVPQARITHDEQNRPGKKKSARRIWMFHYGAYRFYRKNMTWGYLDPRALVAAAALTARGCFQLIQNAFIAPEQQPAPSPAASESHEQS